MIQIPRITSDYERYRHSKIQTYVQAIAETYIVIISYIQNIQDKTYNIIKLTFINTFYLPVSVYQTQTL